MNRATWHIGSEGLAFIADSTSEIEQSAEHRLADRYLEWSAAGMGNNAAPQSRGRLQGDRPNSRLVQMGLHLGDDRCAFIGHDNQSVVNWRQHRAVKDHVQHRTAYRGYPTINRFSLCNCLFRPLRRLKSSDRNQRTARIWPARAIATFALPG
jgi:hypothetical protein